jgi:chemotaxis response regulator CheB
MTGVWSEIEKKSIYQDGKPDWINLDVLKPIIDKLEAENARLENERNSALKTMVDEATKQGKKQAELEAEIAELRKQKEIDDYLSSNYKDEINKLVSKIKQFEKGLVEELDETGHGYLLTSYRKLFAEELK